MLVGSEFVKCR